MLKSDKPILLLSAIPEEFIAIKRHLKAIKRKTLWHGLPCIEGTLFGKKIITTISGLGKVSAAITCQQLIFLYQPRAVIVTGAAGSLSSDLHVGDVIISRDTIQHDVDITTFGYPRGTIAVTMHNNMIWRIFIADKTLRKLALKTKPAKHTIREGRILTGDQFITVSHRKKFDYLIHELRGDAVDMEGAAIAQTCYANKTPFVIIKTISDKANDTATQDFNKVKTTVTHNSLAVIQSILQSY